MHDDEFGVTGGLVARLVASQLPQWATLPLRRVPSAGTMNAIYRLGDAWSVRIPLTEGASRDIDREFAWLPLLAPRLPIAVPRPVARGEPGDGYPWRWSVHTWLNCDALTADDVPDPVRMADDLATVVKALRGLDLPGSPPSSWRASLAADDERARRAIEQLVGVIDTEAATAAWEDALTAREHTPPDVWVHGDLMPSNLLVTDGRLGAILDFGSTGLGDPAGDLIPAWNLLPADARTAFRDALGVDDATWARGRGRALFKALLQLPYYRHTNPGIAANARHTIQAVLAEHAGG